MRTTLTSVVLFVLFTFANPAFAVHPETFQTSDMNDIDGVDISTTIPTREGAAWLKRSRTGLKGRVMVNVGTAGLPYTVWFVIFNNPQACEGVFLLDADGNEITQCGEDDLMRAGVDAAVIYGSGIISSDTDGLGGGTINVDVEAFTGKVPEGQCCFGRLRWGKTFRSEVHLVVARHPAIAPGDSWVTDLTTPFANHRVAIFLPAD